MTLIHKSIITVIFSLVLLLGASFSSKSAYAQACCGCHIKLDFLGQCDQPTALCGNEPAPNNCPAPPPPGPTNPPGGITPIQQGAGTCTLASCPAPNCCSGNSCVSSCGASAGGPSLVWQAYHIYSQFAGNPEVTNDPTCPNYQPYGFSATVNGGACDWSQSLPCGTKICRTGTLTGTANFSATLTAPAGWTFSRVDYWGSYATGSPRSGNSISINYNSSDGNESFVPYYQYICHNPLITLNLSPDGSSGSYSASPITDTISPMWLYTTVTSGGNPLNSADTNNSLWYEINLGGTWQRMYSAKADAYVTYPYDWSALAAGTYSVRSRFVSPNPYWCSVTDNNSVTINGGPTSTPTSTPTPTPTPTTPTTTPTPGPWYKLRDASFNKLGPLNNPIPASAVSFGSDDPGNKLLIDNITNDPGPVIYFPSYNLGQAISPYFSGKGWSASYSPSSPMTPAQYLDYIKSRKQYVTSTGSFTPGVINIFTGNLSIDTPLENQLVKGGPNKTTPVLFVNGDVTINTANGTFNVKGPGSTPDTSITIISTGNITFGSAMTNVNGIFIATNINFSNTLSTTPLEIRGNVISQTAVDNSPAGTGIRNPASLSSPSIFIYFDPQMYIDLLAYLSTSTYDWKQLQ